MKKHIAAIAAAVMISLAGCDASEADEMTVSFFEAGKADAILIETEEGNILIDTGLEENKEELLEELAEKNIEEINALILTHFDKDHAGGADAVIENLKVDYVYTTWRSKESDETEEFDEALSEAGIKANVIKGTQTFTIGGARFEIYGASESYEKDESNNSSLIIRVSFGKKSYLFMGDAQDERITEFLNSYETDADFIKIPYHGHMQDTLAQLIEAVSPESAVITNSKAEPEAEEIAETEALLLENGVTFHETADGTVTMICTADLFLISQ